MEKYHILFALSVRPALNDKVKIVSIAQTS